jgi:ribonuclease HI
MEKLGKLLRLIACGVKLEDAWKESGYASRGKARRALEALAGTLETAGANDAPQRRETQTVPGGTPEGVEELIIYADGASRGNPGPSAVAAIAYLPSGELLTSVSKRIGRATNNVAEYRAVLEGLRLARMLRAVKVVIRLDSELVVKQLNGEYRVKSHDLRPFADAVIAEASSFKRCTFTYVARSENTEADRLANRALDIARGDE